jgi:beta-ring hydroxylase
VTVAIPEMPSVITLAFWTSSAIGAIWLFWLLYWVVESVYRRWCLADLPYAPGSIPLLRHLHKLALHPAPWNLMSSWIESTNHDMITWGLPLQEFVLVRGGEAMKTVFQTRFKDWHKDVGLSFHPFLCILGTGLVTSEGELWQKQRKLMTPAFKGDILQEVIEIGLRASSRLREKLENYKGTEKTVEIEEEFRLLTLQARFRPCIKHTPSRLGTQGRTPQPRYLCRS